MSWALSCGYDGNVPSMDCGSDDDEIRGKVIVGTPLRAPGRVSAPLLGRPEELSHAETVLYEIDLLRYSANRLREASGLERWIFLESFLLHFRNLIEFFGNPRRRGDTLSISDPEKFWPLGSAVPSAELAQLWRKDLWEKYEGEKPDKISRYLQHCTEQRVAKKNWDLKTMIQEIEPLLEKFEDLLPIKSRGWAGYPTRIEPLDHASYSTMSGGTPLSMSGLNDSAPRVIVVREPENR